MRESVHSLPNFEIYVAVFRDPVPQVVFFDDAVREVCKFQLHVLVSRHGRHQVEILNINGHEACPNSVDYNVEQ